MRAGRQQQLIANVANEVLSKNLLTDAGQLMQFLSADRGPLREALLSDIFFNGLTTFFVMCGLVIGAIVPLFAFHRESILVRTIWRKAHPNEERESAN